MLFILQLNLKWKNLLTLTPNRRLAAFLTREHNTAQVAAGKLVWTTPQILHLKGWFTQLWQLCVESVPDTELHPIINDVQQQLLWEEIIRSSSVGVELLRIGPTAKSTIQAWKFMRQWQVSVAKLAAYAEYSADTYAFYTWLQGYLAWLEKNSYTDYDLMIDDLIEHLPHFVNKLPQQICLMGVDELTPQQAAFFKKLVELGVSIEQQSMLQTPQQLQLHSFSNHQSELQAAAQWAEAQLKTNPTQIIAVVVPNLELHRRAVVRAFGATIPTELMNISAPLSLSNFGVIEHALLILQLCKHTISYEDFSIILRSPYINTAAIEANIRAKLDRELRDKVEAKITWPTLTKTVTDILVKKFESMPLDLDHTIRNMSDILNLTNGQHKPSAWTSIFARILEHWHWPGGRGVTRSEMDLLTCWHDLLSSYCKFDILGQTFSYSQALQLLQRIASETPFLPAETGATRLHILGVLEAAGINFDQLWVTGMDRDSWPPDAAPNAFIPSELQRQVDMPRSSPQRELKVARRLTETLKQGAKHAMHFSYAAVIDDHVTTVSNLLADIPLVGFNLTAQTHVLGANELEQITDIQAPLLTNMQVKGGATVLKLQAQCPFKAFAEIRMQAKKLEVPQLILNSQERGKIVHNVLEDFWKRCKTQNKLRAWLPDAAKAILDDIIVNILTKWQQKFPITLNANYIELEKKRLKQLITRWLEYELERAPFEVTEIEQKVKVNLGPLELSVRLDRLDTLSSGKIVIIDYKTGVTQTADWFREAIVEPQMPLYAISAQNEVAAIVFANIVSQHDKLKFSGIGQNGELLPGTKEQSDWDMLLTVWRQKLGAAAQDFANGNAAVAPYNEMICKRCNLQALCRVYDS